VADTGIAGYAAPVAAVSAGTGFLNTFSDRPVVEQAQVQRNASRYSNRYDSVPIPDPSAVPNAEGHLTASQQNMQAVGGSSAPEYVGYTGAQNQDLQNSMGHCTKSLRTSNHPEKPSTCRRKRNSWHPCVVRNRPGIPEHGQVEETSAG
jgi:hypothetical protein